MLHDFLAHFPAPAGLLVAAERPGGVSVIVGVDADRAGPDLARHHVSGLQIGRPDACGQAIFCVVGEFRDRVQLGRFPGNEGSLRRVFLTPNVASGAAPECQSAGRMR